MVPIQSLSLSVYAPVRTDAPGPVKTWLQALLSNPLFAPTHMAWDERKPIPIAEIDFNSFFEPRKGGVMTLWRSTGLKSEIYLTTTILPMNAVHMNWEKLKDESALEILQSVSSVVMDLRPFTWASMSVRWKDIDPADSMDGQSPLPMEFCKAGPHGAYMINWYGESLASGIGHDELKKLGAEKTAEGCWEINLVRDPASVIPEQIFEAQKKLTTALRETGFFGDHTFPPGIAGPRWVVPEGMPVKKNYRAK